MNGGNVIPQLGLVDMPAHAYHADLIDELRPALSKSIICTLLNGAPAHARAAHPKLNPDYKRVDEAKFDLGTAAHDLFLEGVDKIAAIPFDDWRTKAANEARDEARAAGLIPLLSHQAEEVHALVTAIRTQLDNHQADPPLFSAGTPERTIVWEDRGVLCKARLDWLRDDHLTVDDLKTAGRSANPEQWCRTTLFSIGADIQVAFYLRGLRKVTGRSYSFEDFRFVVVETEPPYALSVVSIGPDVMALADRKITWALDRWSQCLESGEWPAYDQRVHFASLPPWEENRWLEREAREEEVAA